jgi:hypothetical protein
MTHQQEQVVAARFTGAARAGQPKQVRDGVTQLLRLGERGEGVVAPTFGLRQRQRFETQTQRGETAAQLMRRVGREVALGADKLLDTVGRTVQRVADRVDLREARVRNLAREIA